MTRLARNVLWFGVGVALMAALAAAMATEPPKPPAPTTLTQNQSQMQNQGQGQDQAQTANSASQAAGGASSATGQGGSASNAFTDHSTFAAFSTQAPLPVAVEGVTVPPCWLPTAARSYVFGVYANSSRYRRNKACLRDLESARAHELAVATATQTVERVEVNAGCAEYADRSLAACASK